MNVIRLLRWRVLSEAARLIEEEYEDTYDALLMPLLGLSLTATLAVATRTLFAVGGVLNVAAGVVTLLLALVVAPMTFTMLVASVTYARERTTEPLATEVMG